MKKLLIIILSLCFSINGFSQIDSVKAEIQKNVGKNWLVEINDSIKFSHPYLKKGKYLATLYIIGEIDTVEFLLFSSLDSNFGNEITNYHKLASCYLTKENYKAKFFHAEYYFLFLHFYPCWNVGYSENSKELIKKLFEK